MVISNEFCNDNFRMFLRFQTDDDRKVNCSYSGIIRNDNKQKEQTVSWSYGSWIYNYLCNQCLSPLTLWVRIPLMRGILDRTLDYKSVTWGKSLVLSGYSGFLRHDITEMLLKGVLNTTTL
jgi:hypothetical protein